MEFRDRLIENEGHLRESMIAIVQAHCEAFRITEEANTLMILGEGAILLATLLAGTLKSVYPDEYEHTPANARILAACVKGVMVTRKRDGEWIPPGAILGEVDERDK